MNCVFYESQSGQSARCSTKILRNSTEINADKYGAYNDYNVMGNYLVSMLDTPSVAAGTTLTYKLQAKRQAGSGQCLWGYGDGSGGCGCCRGCGSSRHILSLIFQFKLYIFISHTL